MTSSRPWLSNCCRHSGGVIYEAACTALGGQDNLEAALLRGDVTKANQDNITFYFLPTMARGKKGSFRRADADDQQGKTNFRRSTQRRQQCREFVGLVHHPHRLVS